MIKSELSFGLVKIKKLNVDLQIELSSLISVLILVCIIVLTGGNGQNPDLRNYIENYQNVAVIKESIIYTILVRVCTLRGISYRWFRMMIYALGYCTLWKASKRFGCNRVIFYLSYAISLMMIDSTQTYNFMGMVFLFNAVSHLVYDEKRNRTVYVFWVLIAAGFHIVFLFYIPFVFIYQINDRNLLLKVFKTVIFIMVVLSTVVSVSGLTSVLKGVLSIAGMDDYQSYLLSRTRYGHFFPIIEHLVCCIFTYYIYQKAARQDLPSRRIIRILFLLNLFGIIAFPLFRYQLTIARFTRNLELVTFASSAIFIRENRNKYAGLYVAIGMLTIAVVLGYFAVFAEYKDVIVVPFWKENWLLGGQA